MSNNSHNNIITPIITIDGPVGSGKGTISVMLAKHLGYHLLDSGAIYRVLALDLKKHNTDVTNEQEVSDRAVNLNVRFEESEPGMPAKVILNNIDVSLDIRQEECGKLASEISKFHAVRAALMGRQRAFLKSPGLVADGRDMGTVVFPDANSKFFLTASQEVRAKRRYEQLQSKLKSKNKLNIDNINFNLLLQDIKKRDEQDTTRKLSPLKPADDAIVIDSSDMNINQVFNFILSKL